LTSAEREVRRFRYAKGADNLINGIKINFSPENTKGKKLTIRAFKDDCLSKERCVFCLRRIGEKESSSEKINLLNS